MFFFFKQKTAYEMRISEWSSDVCSSDLELAMHEGCKSLEYFKKKKGELDKDGFEKLIKEKCTPMRQDGPFIEAGENDNLIVQRIEEIGRASWREECVSTGRSRWSPYH